MQSKHFSPEKLLTILIIACLTVGVLGCTGTSTPTIDPLAATQAVMNIQQTQQAIAATQIALDNAQAPADQPVSEPLPTLPPENPPADNPTPQPNPEPPPPPTAEPAPEEGPDFDAWMPTANVLIYEDIIYHPKLERYVRKTAQEMGINMTYVGSAIGEFKKKLLLEAPPGGWDLIIVAAEAKIAPQVKGEYFTYLYDALNQGTPVIMELWYLDTVSEGTIEPILEDCGIEWQKDWGFISARNQIMWPLAYEHPVLNVPNDDLSFTKTTGVWALNWDIGDMVKKVEGGDALLLVGVSSSNPEQYGTLTICMNDHLLLQTFSSHQLAEDEVRQLWENYIYNSLKVRYADLSR